MTLMRSRISWPQHSRNIFFYLTGFNKHSWHRYLLLQKSYWITFLTYLSWSCYQIFKFVLRLSDKYHNQLRFFLENWCNILFPWSNKCTSSILLILVNIFKYISIWWRHLWYVLNGMLQKCYLSHAKRGWEELPLTNYR